jgi:4-hydroxybenzoate polyprenyltransferase
MKRLRLIISIVVCFLLGALPWMVGPHLGWDTAITVIVMLVLCGVSTTAFTIINKAKDKD